MTAALATACINRWIATRVAAKKNHLQGCFTEDKLLTSQSGRREGALWMPIVTFAGDASTTCSDDTTDEDIGAMLDELSLALATCMCQYDIQVSYKDKTWSFTTVGDEG
jgi:hypothetical protein